jgi:hypothetical protein
MIDILNDMSESFKNFLAESEEFIQKTKEKKND